MGVTICEAGQAQAQPLILPFAENVSHYVQVLVRVLAAPSTRRRLRDGPGWDLHKTQILKMATR